MDGYRVGCLIENGQARLISRNGRDWTSAFPDIVRTAETLGVGRALIDGELVVLLPDGRTSFEGMQQAVAGRRARGSVVYFAFDLLVLEKERIARQPLDARKARLRALLTTLGKDGRIRYTDHIEGRGAPFFEQACRMGLEGIVSKRRDLPYLAGRSDAWLKVKCQRRGLFVIGGFTDPAGSRAGIGALLVGRYDDGRLVFCGRVGTGFSEALSLDLRKRLDAAALRQSPFDPPPPGPLARTGHWTKPALVCEATFTEWTSAGLLRHPSFQGLKPGIDPRTIFTEP
jgi:bifunctional non-homologous end joining protein LigD